MADNYKIILVGDRPSAKNIDPDIPFVGTKSYERIQKWVAHLGLTDYVLLNSFSENDQRDIINNSVIEKCKWIALGNNASKVLSKLNIQHFKLPHPSGRNRLLNDKSFEQEILNQAFSWLSDKG